MTDDEGEQHRESHTSAVIQPVGAACQSSAPETQAIVTKAEMFQFLSENPKIVFKSQQIDDPDLTANEKIQIAEEIYTTSTSKFLIRFGEHLQTRHLQFIQANSNHSADDEIDLLIENLLSNLKTHDRDVKNRRYATLQIMLKENNYFSDREMMKREPYLYEQMIGQYLTEAEKRARDREGQEGMAFSSILLDNYDKDQREKLRKKQENDEESDDDTQDIASDSGHSSSSSSYDDERLYPDVAAAQRKPWGGFDSDSIEDAIPKRVKKVKKEEKFITGGERDMLRHEFMGIMYENFLSGKDKSFDYSAVDGNAELDDLEQIRRDSEDKYFEDDENSDREDVKEIEENRKSDKMSEGSEDELDVYMRHLSKHPSCQQQVD